MENVSKEFVNALCENLYLGYGNNNASIPTLGKSNVKGLTGVDNIFTQPGGTGEGSGQDHGNKGKGSGDGGVTSDQTAGYDAASKAGPGNDTFSHEAVADDGASDLNDGDPTSKGKGSKELPDITTKWKEPEKVSGTGLPETIGNRWSMPKPLVDHQEEIESSDHPASEEPESASLQERVAKLEEAVASFLDVIQSHLEEKASYEDKPTGGNPEGGKPSNVGNPLTKKGTPKKKKPLGEFGEG